MDILKQSTAVTVVMGPMLNSTDGNTPETALTISQADIRLSKNGGAFAQSNNAAGATHMEVGNYSIPLNTTDTATLGKLRVSIHESGALPTWREFMIVPANVYDSAVLGTDKLEVDAIQLSNSAQSLLDLKDFADAGYDPATNKVQGVVLVDTLYGHTVQTGDNFVRIGTPISSSISTDISSVQTDTATLTSRLTLNRAGYLDNLLSGAVALASVCSESRLSELDAGNIPSDVGTILYHTGTSGVLLSQSSIDLIWDEPCAPHTLSNTLGEAVTLALSDIDDLHSDWTNGGRLDLILDIIAADTTTDIPAKILKYAQLLVRSDAAIATDNATELTAINADGGSGAGDFSNQTEAIEAIRDRGDAAWVTGAGGSAPTVGEIRTEMEGAGTKLTLTLEDTADLQGNQSAWATATGFSTHSAADIWSVGTRALTDKSGFALSATGANLILKDSAFALAMADATWDEILSGATHNIVTSAGRRVREIGAFAIHSGTAQAGSSNSITLAATADAVDGTYNRNLIVITDNTGVGQTRTIVDYNGTTKIAVIDRDWRTSPDVTTTYQITPDNTPLVVDQGIAQAGTATTITLRAYASSINDTYLCNVIAIIAGTGRGQARLVGAYNGTSKIVTICGDNWVTTPDATSVYAMMPYGTTCTSCIGTHALSLIKSEADDALTDIKLDHLIAVADGDDPVNDSIIAQMAASDGDWSGFAKADDALEAIRDRGDAAWTTATSVTVSDKTGFALSEAGIDAIFDENIEGTHTFREMVRLFAAMLVGKVSGGGTTTIVFRDIDDSKNRIVMTVTEVGNRTDLILTED